MKFFPDMRTFLEINFLNIHLRIAWYAVLILTGAMIAYYVSIRLAKKRGYSAEILENYFVTMLPIAIIGARIWYVIFEWYRFSSNPISSLYIWEGGLAIQGGIIAAIVYSYFYFKRKGINLLRVGDCIMPNVLIAQAIGRWGNFMNQEAYGQIVNKDSLNWLPNFIKDKMYIDGHYRQPMFLIESIGNIIGWILIMFVYRKHGYKKKGDMVYAYFCWYGIVRFFVEAFRSDSLMFMGLKVAQIISIMFIVIGVLGILGVYDRLFKNYWPFKNNKPTLIFDFDGTLADSFPIIQKTFKHVFKTFPLSYEVSDEEIKTYFGPTLHDTFSKHYEENKIDEIIEEYRRYNHEIHNELKPIKNAIKLLDYLKSNNYDIAVVSSKGTESLNLGLKVLNMDKYFDVVIGADDVKNHKPNPEGISRACELLHVGTDDLIYIGDTKGDIKAAKNIGAFSIVLSKKDNKEQLAKCNPCLIVDDLADIIPRLEEDREWNEQVLEI